MDFWNWNWIISLNNLLNYSDCIITPFTDFCFIFIKTCLNQCEKWFPDQCPHEKDTQPCNVWTSHIFTIFTPVFPSFCISFLFQCWGENAYIFLSSQHFPRFMLRFKVPVCLTSFVLLYFQNEMQFKKSFDF